MYGIEIRSVAQAQGKPNTSASKSFMQIKDQSPDSIKVAARALRGIRTLDLGSFGLFGGGDGAAIGTMVQETVRLVNKGFDIALDFGQSLTGETVDYNNIRRVKSYVLNPKRYLVDATWGVYLTRLENRRNNAKLDYYQDLTGNLQNSKMYGDKR